MLRILITDDSPTARALLAGILGSDPEIQVVGEATDGVEAVKLTQELRPDLVVMDAQMPRMDGFEATKEIMVTAPTPIIIDTASLNPQDVAVSMRALDAGALTVLPKPPGPSSAQFAEAARQFVATVKAMAQVKVVRHHRPRPHSERAAPAAPSREARGRVVAIATSTGGPAALAQVLADLPRNLAAPVLVVQHISPAFTPGLAVWLKTVSRLPIKLAEHGEPLVPATVYLAPESRHLGVSARSTVALANAPPVGGFRPSGTWLFESVAKAFGPAAVAVIMTGMGEDGVQGLRAVRQAGGFVIAQDEASSVVFGMPGAAIAAGLADAVLPLDALALRLAGLVRSQ